MSMMESVKGRKMVQGWLEEVIPDDDSFLDSVGSSTDSQGEEAWWGLAMVPTQVQFKKGLATY